MKKLRRALSVVLALVMILSLLPIASAAKPFEKKNEWKNENFSDISSDNWFYENVRNAYELGLMKGIGKQMFNPAGSITIAESITIASRIHAIALTGEDSFIQGEPWYQVYIDYALANGIITEVPTELNRKATRLEFATILASALSSDDLPEINTIEDGIIPDLPRNDAVYKLYRAGVLTGNDENGTFAPNSTISRSEVSAITSRMALPGTRIKKDLKNKTNNKNNGNKNVNASTPGGGSSSSRPNPNKPQKPEKVEVSANVEVDENGNVKSEISMNGDKVNATVPAGVAVDEGAKKLTLTVEEMKESGGNIETGDDETLASYDVHIDGISAENTVAIKVFLGEILPIGMNLGNVTLYHIEDGETNAMTQVSTLDELDAHNEFYYDPATGNVTIALASFSEIALVADTVAAWEGNFDYSWYTNAVAPVDGESEADYIIANADQLAAFGAIVGGMDDQTQNSFAGKTVKLVADVNLGDKDNANKSLIFHPIGYYYVNGDSTVKSFKGIFDGNGHTIANFYQNTWEINGDYDGTYYKDAMGLFGYVANGTIKNLTVDNFSSDGEYTPTGVIAAYAYNSTFENIAITNCNPRVYNTGNGGIVGIGGNSDDPDTYKLTFTNITIDNTNKITALWGSWDVACGGLVGMFRGAGHVYMTNCHVAAQLDVYNDVCGNYQYYWYRYSGMMVGTNKNMITDKDGYTVPETSKFHAEGCTVHFGNWNDYYYCELVANSLASYTHDHQFSRLEQISSLDEIKSGDAWTKTGNFLLISGDTKTCYHIVKDSDGTFKQHLHTDAGEEVVNGETVLKENNQIIYLPFNQLFTGYGWGVKHIPVYNGEGYAFEGITILDREVADSVEKFEKKFTGDFLYRVGNQNVVSVGSLFAAKEDETINNSGVVVSIDKVNENSNVSGTFTADTSDWTKGTIQFSGTGVVKVTIQDYNFCTPTELYLEVVDATNLTSATGTTTGGNFVLLCDVNTSNYVNYWHCTLYGNGFTYSLKGAPTSYNSKQGHGILITKNATLDNLVIVGDVYNSYGAYTNQDYYNTAVDVVGETTIQNCYISGCSAPVKARSNVTITNTTLYGGAVANLLIMSGTATLEDVTTANYDDGRAVVGMGIVIHSDATETAKLVLNGTLTQYNFINESKVPTDSYATKLHEAMFGTSCSKYHFGTSPNRYVNAGIISLTALFNAEDITDNANTGYVGTAVTVSGKDGYVYTQPNTSGSVNNGYDKENDPHVATTQGAVPPSYSFDFTSKNYVAKTDGSNDYCYEENGKVNISMDEGDIFNWDTSILTLGKGITNYTVSMDGTDYTGKSIAFNTAGDYEVKYTYTDNNNYKLDENGNITTYSVTYTKTVNITVAVIEAATKHAEFTFGSSNTASTTVTIGNNTYVMPNVSGTSSTIGSTTVSGQTIYYPIVEIIMSDGKTSHSSGWYAYFPVFSGAVTITDYANNGTGDAMTPYNGSTTTMPSGLSVVGDPAQLFKYQSSSAAGSTPVVKSNKLVYSSASISAKRDEYNTVIQYSYTDNAGATYYYYIGYHAPAQSYSSCFTSDTLITLADGSQKRIDEVTYDDKILAWDFFNGEYTTTSASIIKNHGYDNYTVVTLNFADGTDVKIINGHGFFDADNKKFVLLDEYNVADYIGHNFVTSDVSKATELISYDIKEEYTESWSILTSVYYNCMIENMLSVTPAEAGYSPDYLMPFEVNADMKFDESDMTEAIKTYGLYTYEDFDDVITREQFDALNLQYFKIAVGKGQLTYDDILYLINLHMN